ncbi:MAG: right-handed parallel beta-helix repeat-containing protein [Acidobacteria bacterium]|nr:right-handed parallel beta-helix repeat-containing protein [Acidobacteriota bacterium]
MDGGTAEQCTGTASTPYPGSGANQNCAWAHPFWALDAAGAWKIRGGDSLVIQPGNYAIGYGAPNSGWCTREGAFACGLPPLPSGPAPQTPTRLVGSGWESGCPAMPELWGTQRVLTVVNLDKTSNAVIGCLEISDRSGCVEFHANSSVRCERNRYPYGEWGAIGIHAVDSSNVTLRNLNIHGMAHTGIQAGRLSNWAVEDVRIAANGWVGWDGDLGDTDSSNSGTMAFRRWKVEWNGCAETYPGRQPDHCWAQSASGYGDGVGVGRSAGHWIIEDSEFRNNTSDGLDLLYLETVRGERPAVEVRRSISAGNAGNQIKVAGNATIVNTVAVGNCAFFLGKPFAQEMGGLASGDQCRAQGAALALSIGRGDAVRVVNSTIVGQGDTVISAECRARLGGGVPPCDGSEALLLQNNIFAGYGDIRGGDETGLMWDPDNFTRGRSDYNIIHRVKEAPCPGGSRNVCADPLFVNGSLDSFDGRLRAGSPAIDSGLAAGSLSGLIPQDDITGAPRPNGSGVDRGAYEFGAVASTPLIQAIVSAASGQPNSVAPGSMISIYGQRLSEVVREAPAPYPAAFGDLQVLFGDSPAGLIYADDGLINLQVPDLAPGSSYTVRVRRGALSSPPFAVQVVPVAPAVFETRVNGERRGAITDLRGTTISSATPASAGQVLIAYLTGLGAADPLPGSGGLLSSRVRPRVLVDAREAELLFAGPQPTTPGQDQINFVVPAGIAGQREAQFWIEQLDRVSNVVPLRMR